MTDQQDTHQRYRGGGREVRDRWNRADHYGPRTRHGEDRTTTRGYDRETTGKPTGRDYRERLQQPSQRYSGQRGQPPQGTQPGYDRGSAGEQQPARPRQSPHESQERRAERTSPDRLEIPAGSRQPPEGRPTDEIQQTGRQRQPERASGPGRQPSGRGRRQDRWTGRSAGQGWQEPMREGQVEYRRPTAEHGQESQGFESDADTTADESQEGGGLEQPRDPETGRFLSKDEAKRQEE